MNVPSHPKVRSGWSFISGLHVQPQNSRNWKYFLRFKSWVCNDRRSVQPFAPRGSMICGHFCKRIHCFTVVFGWMEHKMQDSMFLPNLFALLACLEHIFQECVCVQVECCGHTWSSQRRDTPQGRQRVTAVWWADAARWDTTAWSLHIESPVVNCCVHTDSSPTE